MRATDGRPYELQSVPTKTVAVRTSGNCSDLVQKLCLHPCLPLEGKVSAKPADEVKFKSVRRSRTPQLFIIHYSLFIRRLCLRCRDTAKSVSVQLQFASKSSPLLEIVTTCRGSFFPAAATARVSAACRPPQQGTCIRVRVTDLMSFAARISPSFSA